MNSNYSLLFLVFFPMLGALVTYGIGRKNKRARDFAADIVVIVEFLVMLSLALQKGSMEGLSVPGVCGMGLHFTLDGFRKLYGLVIALMWMMTTIFSREYFIHYRNRNRYYLFNLLTLGATMGVFLSSDLYTTFIFFEMMSFTSYVWVAQDEKKPSLRAAETYLAVAVIGGLVMLMGIFLLYAQIGTLDMADLAAACGASRNKPLLYVAGVCMAFGFGAKAGAFPLHIWLPKAHPVAPAPASALLSGILTKSGIFGILVISCNIFYGDGNWGRFLLVIGLITMAGGAVLAVFSVDLKRTLACSSMSQIGFILTGIAMMCLLGEENALAARGTLLHMVNHSLIKLVLFLCAGVVYMNLHKLNLNDIRGFGRKKPLLNFVFLMGALSIAGVPLFSGYISKTLLHESILEYSASGLFKAAEWIFLCSGGLTAAYMTKLYLALFVEKNADAKVQQRFDSMKHYMNTESAFALTVSAVLLPLMGIWPHQTMDQLAQGGLEFLRGAELEESISYFSFGNLKGGLISLSIGAVVYLGLIRPLLMSRRTDADSGAADMENGEEIREYVDRWPKWLDLEEVIYRPLLLRLLPFVFGVICRALDSLVDTIIVILRKTVYRDKGIPYELPEGNLFTKAVGSILNGCAFLLNKTFRKRNPITRDYVHQLAMVKAALAESNTLIGRSLSFGLLLFAMGLLATLVYLLTGAL
ncbi:MAG: complex I subunit 5 family protein [Lachnospiraceae bacterium]|nr:complex I subunit 5 family protein [Lachnospiraceae bacterium]